MEPKTIGNFIATLRKARGMTQRELAERLHVSDKTISRWECDDSAPDLSLIPVIAELFGVTCDELLRGERRPIQQQEETPTMTPKGEKAAKHLIQAALSQYSTRSLLATAVAAVGLLAALVANTFHRAQLGFLLACAFGLAAGVWQAANLNRGLLAVSAEDMPDEAVHPARYRMIVMASRVGCAVAMLIMAALPMMLFVPGSYYGISADTLLVLMPLVACGTWLLWSFVHPTLLSWLHRRGTIRLSETDAERLRLNRALKAKLALLLTALLLVTGTAHVFAANNWSAYHMAKPMIFEDYESFVAFMETDTSAWSSGQATAPLEVFGAEEPLTALKRGDGTVVVEYRDLNTDVIRIEHGETDDGSLLPIYVTTHQAVRAAQGWVDVRNVIFTILYALEAASIIAVYLKKRVK